MYFNSDFKLDFLIWEQNIEGRTGVREIGKAVTVLIISQTVDGVHILHPVLNLP